MKSILTVGAMSLALFAGTAQGVVVTEAYYRLGETGSLGAGNRPQDSSGNGHHFTGLNGAAAAVSASVSPLAGSSASLTDSGISGYFGSAVAGSISNDFAVDMWAKTTSTTQNIDVFMANGHSNGSLKLSLFGGNWVSSYHNQANIGGGVPIVSDEWARLTVVRYGGIATFFVNGNQVGGTSAIVPTNSAIDFNQFHLSVQPGGSSGFTGNYDELRIWRFNSATDSFASVTNAVFAIPEPATLSLLAMGGLAALGRRRRIA